MTCCICAIAKNENNYINDWVNYYLNLGVDSISIFDNNDVSSEWIGNRIDRDLLNSRVKIIPASNFTAGFQVKVYTAFYNAAKNTFDWLGFFDIDEFLMLPKYKTIPELLNTIRKDINVLRLNWQIYGDDGIVNGDISIPIYKRITNKLNHQYNFHGKCFVRGGLDDVLFTSSHYPLINGQVPVQCSPSNQLIGRPTINLGRIEYNTAYLAHYMTKTWSEFKSQKLGRTDAGFDRTLTIQYYKNINPLTKISD